MIYGHGGDIYTYTGMQDFSVNVNPLGPPERVVQAAKLGAEQMAAYPDSRCRELRQKLAWKQGVSPENYIFGNGAADLIYRLVLAEKPSKALLPVPSFSEYEQALSTVGCEIIYHETSENNGFCIEEDFLNELEKGIDVVFLCSPSNPSGQVIQKALLVRLAERCERLGIRLVLDECFVEFLDELENCSMIRETEQFHQIFLLRAFTKIYAMPGIRLGYAVSSDRELLERMEKCGQPWSVSLPAQKAGTAALDEDDYVEETRRMISGERKYLEKELEKRRIKFVSSRSNFILLYTDMNLFEMLKNRGILIRDCSNYRGLGPGWYRIAVRTHEENSCLLHALDVREMEVSV